jgi:ribonuclease HI
MSARHPLVSVYADESCLGNGKSGDTPGGFGALIEFRRTDGALQRFDLWASERDTTNNRMALRSVIDTVQALSRKGNKLSIHFTTDSRYIVDGMTSWVRGWIARGWKRKEGAVENLELWQDAVSVIAPHECMWAWVKGHAGHPQNEYANHLATRAAAQQDASDGLVTSAFESWMAALPVRAGKPQPAIAPFPDASRFVAAAPLGAPALR